MGYCFWKEEAERQIHASESGSIIINIDNAHQEGLFVVVLSPERRG